MIGLYDKVIILIMFLLDKIIKLAAPDPCNFSGC